MKSRVLEYSLGLLSVAAVAVSSTLTGCGAVDISEFPVAEDASQGTDSSIPVSDEDSGPMDFIPSDGSVDAADGGIQVIDRNAACAKNVAAAKLGTTYLVVQFDRSSSMTGSKITACRDGLKTFFADPASKGFEASLSLFPQKTSNGTLLCATSDYDDPIPTGAMQPLPSATLSTLAAGIEIVSGTPTLPAMKGAHAYAQAIAASKSGSRVAIVLVTDGIPNDCASSVSNVSTFATQIAATGYSTYVIGIGKQLTNLNDIAKAGGTNTAFFVDTANAANISAEFITALNKVRAEAIACDLALPVPPAGETLDYGKINLLYTPNGAAETTLTYDQSCAGSGWKYDNASAPTKIELCPQTCTVVKADPLAKLELLLGCVSRTPSIQ